MVAVPGVGLFPHVPPAPPAIDVDSTEATPLGQPEPDTNVSLRQAPEPDPQFQASSVGS